jgi:hypothetical protein
MKMEWLDRTIIRSPVFYALATSQKLLDQELKRLKVPHNFGINKGDASTNFLTNEDGDPVAIVCLFNYKALDILQVYSLLVHEAVHVFQEIRDNIGEKYPSSEFEAYAIQRISQSLMFEFNRQTKGKSRARTKNR